MTTEFTDELERLRQMILAVRQVLNRDDVEATLLLHQIAERISVLSAAAELASGSGASDEGNPTSAE